MTRGRLGRYPFGVELFHLLLQTGFIPALSHNFVINIVGRPAVLLGVTGMGS
jgi:hypothetical protein